MLGAPSRIHSGSPLTFLHIGLGLIELAVIARVMLRPHRDPSSRIAWVVVIAVLPVVGILAYLLFGETNIGRRRVYRAREVLASLPSSVPSWLGVEPHLRPELPEHVSRFILVPVPGWKGP